MKKTMVILLAASLFISCGDAPREFSPPIDLSLTIRGDVAPLSAGLKEFARLAAERSHHTLIVTLIYTKARLDGRVVLKTIRDGGLDLACLETQDLFALKPEYAVLSLPFLFADDAHFRRVMDGPIGAELLSGLEKDDLIGLGFFDQGALRLFSRNEKMIVPDDFGKKRFRIPHNPALRRAIERLGGFVAPVPEDQAAAALKLGLVDAAADYLLAFEERGFRNVAGRISLLPCARSPFALVISSAAARKLPAAAIDFLRRAARDAAFGTNAPAANLEMEAIGKLTSAGIVVDKAAIPDFAERIEPVYREQPEPVKQMIGRIKAAR